MYDLWSVHSKMTGFFGLCAIWAVLNGEYCVAFMILLAVVMTGLLASKMDE